VSKILIVLFYINYEPIALYSSVVALFFVVLYAISGSAHSFFSLVIQKNTSKIILGFSMSTSTEGRSKIVDKPVKSSEVKELIIF
jgi:hypothetical protein